MAKDCHCVGIKILKNKSMIIVQVHRHFLTTSVKNEKVNMLSLKPEIISNVVFSLPSTKDHSLDIHQEPLVGNLIKYDICQFDVSAPKDPGDLILLQSCI